MNSVVGTVRWGRGGLAAFVVAALGVAGCPMGVPAATAAAPACTITGTPRADVLSGSAGADVICGLGGNDQLAGRGGNDVLFGGAGDDVLFGGDGRDLLRGGPGDDVMQGGAGDDGLQGGVGDDTVGGGPGVDRLRGSGGGDELSGGPGRDIATYMPRAAALRLSIGDGANDGRRGEGDDIAADVEDVRGGIGNDTLIGSNAGNRLVGVAGDDRVVGGRGNDEMAGGAGTDVLDGRDGAGFVDDLSCGAGAGDRVLADMTDTVGAGCEDVVQNDPPTGVVLSDDTVAENLPVNTLVGTLSAVDPDPGDTHTFALVAGSGSTNNGSFTITGSQLRTAEVFDFETKDTYSIRVRTRDADGAFVEEPLTITILGVDELPVAVNDTATVTEDDPATAIDVLTNDTDIDGGPKVIGTVTQPANGTVVITGGGAGLTHEPDPNFCNDPPGTTADAFTYTLNGGSTATVAVTVTCVDDAPVAVDDTAEVAEDSGTTAVDVLANDTDIDGGPKVIVSVTEPDNGTVVISGAGDGLTYRPDANYCNDPPGTTLDTFTYTLNGGSTATVAVTVTCVDDVPVAGNDTATVPEDAAATAVDVLANDVDPDGGTITIVSVIQPTNGTVVITGGGTGLTYQPNPNYCNSQPGATPDTFTYTINGGDSATVSVTVTCFVSISTSLSAAPAAPAINQTFSYDAGLVNSGIVPLDEVTMTLDVPVQMRVNSVTTGTYTGFTGDQAGVGVQVQYEKNTAPGVFTLWGASPNTTTNTTLTSPPPGLGAGEFITRVRWEYGQAAPGASATVNPRIPGQIINPDNIGNPVTTSTAVRAMIVVRGVYTAGPTNVEDHAVNIFNPSP